MTTRVFMACMVLVAAAPASAQIWDGGAGGLSSSPLPPSHVPALLGRVDADIRQARRSGQIDRREARALRRESARIADVTERYRSGGISDSERAELESRTRALKGLVDARRTSGNRR